MSSSSASARSDGPGRFRFLRPRSVSGSVQLVQQLPRLAAAVAQRAEGELGDVVRRPAAGAGAPVRNGTEADGGGRADHGGGSRAAEPGPVLRGRRASRAPTSRARRRPSPPASRANHSPGRTRTHRTRRTVASSSSQKRSRQRLLGRRSAASSPANQAPWDMNAVTKFEQIGGQGVSLVHFFVAVRQLLALALLLLRVPDRGDGKHPRARRDPVLQLGLQSTPSSLDEPNFQLADVIDGTYDSYIREFAEAAAAWGHPFFLRFDWEMNGCWFPWSEGVNGNQPGEYVAAWRHVHDIFTSVGATNATWVWCPNIDPGGDAPPRPGSTRATPTSTGPASTATTGAPTRPSPDRWRSFDELFSRPTSAITDTIAPSQAADDRRDRLDRVRRLEGGLDPRTRWRKSDQLPEDPRPALVRTVRRRHGLADREPRASATSAFAAGIQTPAYATSPTPTCPAAHRTTST